MMNHSGCNNDKYSSPKYYIRLGLHEEEYSQWVSCITIKIGDTKSKKNVVVI